VSLAKQKKHVCERSTGVSDGREFDAASSIAGDNYLAENQPRQPAVVLLLAVGSLEFSDPGPEPRAKLRPIASSPELHVPTPREGLLAKHPKMGKPLFSLLPLVSKVFTQTHVPWVITRILSYT